MMSLSKYLKSKISEQNKSMRKVYEKLQRIKQQEGIKENLSYEQMTRLFSGDQENPSPRKLILLSKALGIKSSEILEVGGFISQKEIDSIIRENVTEFVKSAPKETNWKEISNNPDIIEALNNLSKMDPSSREAAISALSALVRGMKK